MTIDVTGAGDIVWRGPPRLIERYVRASVDIPGGSVEVGVQYEQTDALRLIRDDIRDAVGEVVLLMNGDGLIEQDAPWLTAELERRIVEKWPNRGWFAELWCADECLTQVYAPCGMPRSA